MRPPILRTIATLALSTGLAAGMLPARAADAAGSQACREDAHKLCSSVQPGGGRILACLKQHTSELSAPCQSALPTLERCSQEVQSLCGSSGPREMRSCLRENAAKLSAECRALAPGR